MNKYSNKKLAELAESELIWPRGSKYYKLLLEKSIKDKGWDISKLTDPNEENDLHHDEHWWDLCEIINDLAEIVLEERKKRVSFIKELKQELKDTASRLSSDFNKYL